MQGEPIYDAVVVGSGAAGSMAAYELTAQGLRVAVVELGPPRGRERASRDRKDYRVQRQCHALTKDTARYYAKERDFPYEAPAPFAWIRNHAVGGRLNSWARACMRMTELDFRAAARDGVGIDWPLTRGELDPYYDRAEKLVGAKSAGKNDANARELRRRFESRGWDLRPELKARHADALLERADRTGRLTWYCGTYVTEVHVAQGVARGVRALELSTGRARLIRGKMVFLCASAVETTRILLSSRLSVLARNEALGRYVTDHISGVSGHAMSGYFRTRRNGPSSRPAEPQYYCIPRWQNLGRDREKSFKRGYTTYVYLHEQNPGFVLFHIYALGEMLPRRENRIELSGTVKTKFGTPAPRVSCRLSANERAMGAHIARTIAETAALMMEGDSTARIIASSQGLATPGLNCHEAGGCRMGRRSTDSVVNSRNQVHGLPNLFVTDTSCFTSGGSQNPALTAMALTSRAAQFAVKRL